MASDIKEVFSSRHRTIEQEVTEGLITDRFSWAMLLYDHNKDRYNHLAIATDKDIFCKLPLWEKSIFKIAQGFWIILHTLIYYILWLGQTSEYHK